MFDQIAGAINNPNQQASPSQLGNILTAVQQVSGGRGMNASTTQLLLSVVGSHVRNSLQQKRSRNGYEEAESIVNQYGGTRPNARAVESLFSPAEQQATVQDSAQRTGLNAETIQSLLPVLVPIVLSLLQSGSGNQNVAGANRSANRSGANPVLNAFLDSNGDGEVDIGDAVSLASRFLNQSR
nr:DUF937 domain-containing protein [Oculatella sp. LEGE 06141]